MKILRYKKDCDTLEVVNKTVTVVNETMYYTNSDKTVFYLCYSFGSDIAYQLYKAYTDEQFKACVTYTDVKRKIIDNFNSRIESNDYFSLIELEACKEIGLYEQALKSREIFQQKRMLEKEKAQAEREAKAQAEREAEQAEKTEKARAQKEAKELRGKVLLDNSNILRSDLTNFEKLTACTMLTEECKYYIENVAHWLRLPDIIKLGYDQIRVREQKYASKKVDGCYREFEKPKKTYHLCNSQDRTKLSVSIPAKYAKLLNLPTYIPEVIYF